MFTFRFLNDKNLQLYHLTLGNLAKLVFGQFYDSKIDRQTLSLSQLSLVGGFFEGTRENTYFAHIPGLHPFQKADSSLGCSKGQHAQWGEIISGVATAKLLQNILSLTLK